MIHTLQALQSRLSSAQSPLSVFWFRRDLRLNDNRGLHAALSDDAPVLAIFIFDTAILNELHNSRDRRVEFIYEQISSMKQTLEARGSSLLVLHGKPAEIWSSLIRTLRIRAVFINEDYEPYARQRDDEIAQLLKRHSIPLRLFKDQVIFAKNDVLKNDDAPYTVYTPYKNRWLNRFSMRDVQPSPLSTEHKNWLSLAPLPLPDFKSLGFEKSHKPFPEKSIPQEIIKHYHDRRDYPALNGTSRLGVHLRFGTISIRKAVKYAVEHNETWLNELIWREFYMMILWYFPHVVDTEFKEKYRNMPWRQDRQDFKRWCEGQTGYPMVDAGMRELNAVGYMHNRVRMITAGFLSKHLLIDWRWGERYFAEKLLDYELASNNGNWQWAAGTGCDAAPYFRIFNPLTQQKKFDPDFNYINKWIPEYDSERYPKAMVEHRFARERALHVFRQAIQ